MKYQLLIKKIHQSKAVKTCSNPYYLCQPSFSPTELVLIAEALETIQFLEIIFRAKKKN